MMIKILMHGCNSRASAGEETHGLLRDLKWENMCRSWDGSRAGIMSKNFPRRKRRRERHMKYLSASWNVWKNHKYIEARRKQQNNIEENIVKGISFLEPCAQM